MLAEPVDPVRYHRLYGQKRPRLAYHRNDFLDYVLMITLSAGVACACYGPRSALAVIAVSLCVFMIAVFPVRHGVGFQRP